LFVDIFQKAAWICKIRFSVFETRFGITDETLLFGTSNGNVEKPSFLFQFSDGFHIRRRKQFFFHAYNEYCPVFQTFSRMNGHQCYFVSVFFIVRILIGEQRNFGQKFRQRNEFCSFFFLFGIRKFVNGFQQFLSVIDSA
jgi:hypothetical protein